MHKKTGGIKSAERSEVTGVTFWEVLFKNLIRRKKINFVLELAFPFQRKILV